MASLLDSWTLTSPNDTRSDYDRETDYINDIDGRTALQDPRVLNDLRNYYYELGHDTTKMSDEDLVDEFYGDKRWGLVNSISAGKRAFESSGASDTQKERMRRLDQLWEKLPGPGEEGGTGYWDAIKDYGLGAIADPLNFVPVVGGAGKVANLVRAGAQLTKAQAAKAGAIQGAKIEAGIGAAHAGVLDASQQFRDTDLGYQDGYDVGRAAMNIGIGGATGAVVGAPLGAAGGLYGRNVGRRQVTGGRYLGYTDEEIAQMSPSEARAMDKEAGFKDGKFTGEKGSRKTPEEPDEVIEEPELTPEQAEQQANRENIDSAIREYEEKELKLRKTNSAGANDEQIIEVRGYINKLGELKQIEQRIVAKQAEIDELFSNKGADNAEARKRLADFNELKSDYRYALDAIGTTRFDDAMAEILRGIQKAEAPTTTSAAPTAPTTPTTTTAGATTPSSGTAPVTASAAPELAPPSGSDKAPVTPEAPEAPTVQTEVQIPYRNAAQKTQIEKQILEPYGITEVELDAILKDPDNGVKTFGKGKATKGLIINDTIKEIKAHLDTSKPQVDTTPPAPVNVTTELRGLALDAGVDPNKITPPARSKTGKITKGQIQKAAKELKSPDDYAVQVKREVQDLADKLAGAKGDKVRAIRVLAQNSDYKSDVEDIVALFELQESQRVLKSEVDKPLTQTEKKKIKTLTRNMMKNYGVDRETAEVMAEADILEQRKLDKTPVRGTGQAIEDASKFTTAGRAASTGKIQGILKAGTPISKGSEYTTTGGNRINKSAFGFEEALIRARSGEGPDIVEYTTLGPEKIMTKNGYQNVPSGTTAYADGVSGRPFDSMDFAIEFREGGKPKKPIAAEPQIAPETPDTPEIDLDELVAQYADDPEGLLNALNSRLRNTDAPTIEAPPALPPVTRGDKLVVARNIDDTSDIRIINPKQVDAGKDATAILPKTGAYSNPAKWDIRYVPRELYTDRPSKLQELFDTLPMETGEGVAGARIEAGWASGRSEPVPFEDANKITVPQDKLGEDFAVAFRKVNGRTVPIPDEVPLSLLYQVINGMEHRRWATNVNIFDENVELLGRLHQIFDDVAPQGLIDTQTNRAQSVEQVKAIFTKYSKEELDDAVSFIESLGGDRSIGPRFREGFGDSATTNTRFKPDGDGITQEISLSGQSNTAKDRTSTLYHEVAHWAYNNILTAKDKMEFWSAARKYYDPETGGLNKEQLKDGLGKYTEMEGDFSPDFPQGIRTNSMDSPQEFFAQQFQAWALRKRHIGQDTFWQKISRYAKAIMDRYVKNMSIDSDLEPLFAKILPDNERVKFKINDINPPKTEIGEHITKRFTEQALLRDELEDAILRDSASGIVNATRELLGYFLSVAPRYSKKKMAELAKKGMPISTTFYPFLRMRKTIYDRIDDLSEILSMKPDDYLDNVPEGRNSQLGSAYFDDGLSEGIDEEAVAERIIDFFSKGYEGSYQPSRGISAGAAKRMASTSLARTLDNMKLALEGSYRRTESAFIRGTKPDLEPRKSRPKRGKTVKTARAKKGREETAIDNDAAQVAKTTPAKRPRLSDDDLLEIDPASLPSLRELNQKELRALYAKYRSTDAGDQIAVELLRKEKAKPYPEKGIAIPKEIGVMGKLELQNGYLDAIDANDSKQISYFSAELRRRAANKGKKRGDPTKLMPRYLSSSKTIQQEIADNAGVASSDGIPPSARASIRDLLSFITHRDPETQNTARTMTYRMLNLLNKTAKSNLEETNILTAADLARVANVRPVDAGSSVFVDVRSSEFRKFRSDVRRMSIGLTKGESSPFDLMHEIGHMVVRSGSLETSEKDAILEAYTKSNNRTKDRIKSLYSEKYKDRVDEDLDSLLAEEWFSESLAEYMAERVTKGDILKASIRGDVTDLRLMNSFERALDRALEYVAYVVNGLIGRNDIKQQFRRLVLFGDMFEAPRKNPLADLPRSGPAIHPSVAADAVSDYIMASPRGKRAKIENFVEDGISFNADTEELIPFYHGTPNGYAFNRADNPNVVLRPSQRGFYGPATYLTDNPEAAAQTYARKPTPESIRSQIMDQIEGEDLQEELLYDSLDLHEARKAIGHARRNMYIAQASDDMDQVEILTDKLDELVEVEQSLLDNLSKNGITTDPLVVPLYVRVRNPINFQVNAKYENVQDPALKSIVDYFNMSDTLQPKALQRFSGKFQNGPRNGRETYMALVELLKDSGRGHLSAQQELNGALDDLGYDGMLTTHYNTLDADSSLQRMANGETYEGTQIPHKGVLVFDVQNIKHIDAAEFDSSDPRLYHSLNEEPSMPKGVMGDLALGLMDGQLDSISELNIGAFGDLLEARSTSPELTGALMSMGRGRTPKRQEVKTLNKYNPVNWFKEQANIHKQQGAHWFGDWFKAHFPDVHQEFAKKYFPLHHKMKAMPDAKGKAMTWWDGGFGAIGRTVNPWRSSDPTQPKSHARIVSALRRGSSSRQFAALTNQEKELYRDVRNALDNEWEAMRSEGVMTGRRKHYLPQIWSKSKINADRDAFLNAMASFYKREGTRNAGSSTAPIRTDEQASEFADQMYFKLASDDSDGVFIPEGGGSRNATSDHIDFTRMLDLENDPIGLQDLEPFLEDNLESLMVKYLEGTTRRIRQTQKFGENAHGFHDYVKVLTHGQRGIADLLSTNKVFQKDFNQMGTDGFVSQIELVDTVAMPFSGGRDGAAQKFAANLTTTMGTKGEAAARRMLMDIAPPGPGGEPSKTYVRRVDAIVNALKDFKGQPTKWKVSDFKHMENSLRLAQKKPLSGIFSGDAPTAISKGLRGFNSISLLSYTTLTSLGDPALTLMRSGSFKDWANGIRKMIANDNEYRQMIHDVGVAMENIVHERQIYMYGAANSKLTNAFFNATMLTPWTDMNRHLAGAVGYESFKTEQRRAFKHYRQGVPISGQSTKYKTAHRYLSRYGLQDFLPEGSRSKERLSNTKLLGSDDKLRAGIIRFADESIFQPNVNDIPQWATSPVGAIVMQLKSFPLMMTRLGKYTMDEAFGNMESGKLTIDPKKMNKNFWPLLYLTTAGPMFGAGAMLTKDVLQQRGGETETEAAARNRNLAKVLGHSEDIHGNENDFAGWYVEGMMQMGGLGLLGDIFHSMATQADNGAYGEQRVMSTFLGPSFGLASSVYRTGVGGFDAALGSTESNAKERTAAREVITRIPVLGGNRKFKEAATDWLAGEAGRGGKEWWQK